MEVSAATGDHTAAPVGDAIVRTTTPVVENQISSPAAQETQRANGIIAAFLMKNVAEFRELTRLRTEGWSRPEGDVYFQKQRHNADNADGKTARYLYNMMKEIGEQLHRSTGAFLVSREERNGERTSILDMCMAPGGFLATALNLNRESSALAFSLPLSNGGHKVLLPKNLGVEMKFMDITMLAADMGVADIPTEHPDAKNFLHQKQLASHHVFDLILCDGQVLRTHERAPYREPREAKRLGATQLALGLEHAREGGTMVVLLHKIETWMNVSLLYTFSKFSTVKVFKPEIYHTKRSSFYMVAKDIQSQHPEAIRAVERWKASWSVATFGTDEEYKKMLEEGEFDVKDVLEEFGPELMRLGKGPWSIQARALAKAPFMRACP